MALRRFENPTGHDRPQLIVSCTDCGARYDGYNQSVIGKFLGRGPSNLCRDCRDIRIRSFDVERERLQQTRRAYQHKLWLEDKRCGIPAKFRDNSFADFDTIGNEDRVRLLEVYADTFPTDRPKGIPSLLIARDVNGVGKTHLTCAILRRIIERVTDLDQERCPYQFWPVHRIRQRLLDAQRFNGAETITQVYADFASVWLLALDDVGKDAPKGAEAAALYEMYFTIINERYNAELPLIVTSNLGFKPWVPGGLCLEDVIGKAGASRLMEMTGGTEIIIAGHDRR